MANVLIIDDDTSFCDLLAQAVESTGNQTQIAYTLADGRALLQTQDFDAVMLDVQLPDGVGIDAISEIKALPSSPEVIVITGCGDTRAAEVSIKYGAWDYIEKPATISAITLPLIRAIEYRTAKEQNKCSVSFDRSTIIGSSAAIDECVSCAGKAASQDVTICIFGETGTGKEVLASAIHSNSNRKTKPFVVVDCSVLPDNLMESTLFGHEKGAFTGAHQAQAGLIKNAHGGTLFLDEVGELPLAMQKALLRVLQEHRFRPLGSNSEDTSDFRLIAATNRDLEQMVSEGTFRGDLYFRLTSFVIEIPSLANRKEDIEALVTYRMVAYCEKYQVVAKSFSPEFMEALHLYNWPGNIRELFNCIDTALTNAQNEPMLYEIHLPTRIRTALKKGITYTEADSLSAVTEKESGVPELDYHLKFNDYKQAAVNLYEHAYFVHIAHNAQNAADACERTGLSRSRLYHFLKLYNLSLND